MKKRERHTGGEFVGEGGGKGREAEVMKERKGEMRAKKMRAMICGIVHRAFIDGGVRTAGRIGC